MYDFENEYRQKVVDYMIDEYRAGRTPNPDIMCNQEVKFKLFLNTALEDGADLIATGHYARVLRTEERRKTHSSLLTSHSAVLCTAMNKDKDQSYFLYRVTEEALTKSLMPIGEFASKDEVRQLAKKLNLVTANKKDSQGICFVGKVGIKEFLEQFVTTEPGSIVDRDGKVLGEHEGAIFYTIGQRHGLNVGGGLPYYVTGKNMTRNEVYVTTDLDDDSLWKSQLNITDVHWINSQPDLSKKYLVRTRYRAPLIGCKLHTTEEGLAIVMDEKVRAVTPSQSAVLYDNDRVLGGGIVI
jgi:tRNA-specific 2-thiouridylase